MKHEFAIAEFYGVEDVVKTFNVVTRREHNKKELNEILTERLCFHRDNGNNDFAFAYKDLIVKIS